MGSLALHDAVRLGAEIRHELDNLERTRRDLEMRRDDVSDTATYALSLLLMNYYSGTEKIFQRIAILLGGFSTASDRWHAQLLEDMTLELPGIRPAVVSRDTAEELGQLRRDLEQFLRFLEALSAS